MATPASRDIADLIAEGHETTNLEYKRSAPWPDLRIGLIRTVLGMSNTRGGGHIVIGVAEDNGTFNADGMTDANVDSFPTEEDFLAAVNAFAQPFVAAQLDSREHEGKRFTVITVPEFEDIPILCIKSEKKLRQSAFYVRSKRKPETVELLDQRDQRNFFDLVSDRVRDTSAGQTTPSGQTLLRLLQQCERDWLQKVVPSQDTLFRNQFSPRLQEAKSDAEQQEILAESISAIQPAFLQSWEPIEEVGFHVIEQGDQECWVHLFQTLERTHALPTRNEVRGAHSTVVGHGQLLALRTWTLWGAYALRCENWKAVDVLLHRQVSFRELQWSSISSFPGNSHLYAPDAAGMATGYGYYFPTVQSLYEHKESFAEEKFFDLEEMRGYIGLWLFSVDLACLVETGNLPFPGWIFSPIEQLERLLSNFARKEYATNFLQSVMHDHPSSVNMRWHSIRESLTDYQRLGSIRFPQLRDLRIPERFEEHGS